MSKPDVSAVTTAITDLEGAIAEMRAVTEGFADPTTWLVAIIGLDAELYVTHWNRTAERMYGWSSSEIVGEHWPSIVDAAELPIEAMEENLDAWDTLLNGTAVEHEFTMPTRCGEAVRVWAEIVPIFHQGELVSVVGYSYPVIEPECEKQARETAVSV